MTAEKLENLILENFDSLYEFVDEMETEAGKTYEEFLEENEIEFTESNDTIQYDSYGSENSVLQRIYLYKPTDTYFMLYGTRQSYSGTDWDGIKEVRKNIKTISEWK